MLLEVVLGMLGSIREKVHLEPAAGMLGSQLTLMPVWKVQVATYKPATENKQCQEQPLARFIYFLLSSREVENMIEAERPSVSAVLGLFFM